MGLIFLHKLLHNVVYCLRLLEQLNFLTLPQNNLQFYTYLARLNWALNSFLSTICQNFNNVCFLCIINNCSLDLFILWVR